MANAYVYILASKRNGTLYVGVTSNLSKRILQHKEGTGSKFTARYKVNQLVYYETFDWIEGAITRETHIKQWNRKWKLEAIEKLNPNWNDLYFDLV